eukprot:TRINITY_DN0_c1_g4_i1.p1 TRINITY_DN0_c1_g4~~TRINITY_DN0_c1_g4_i1.p1  ORF type:complete len:499 (-),score=116.96 TRINITY_DN0_c1_g4_i1:656-2152(-)
MLTLSSKLLKTHLSRALVARSGLLLRSFSNHHHNPIDIEDARFIDHSSDAIKFDFHDCIACGFCIAACEEQADVLTFQEVSGLGEIPRTISGEYLADTNCIECGQCANVCPVDCITEVDHLTRVENAMADPDKIVVLQAAPSTRVAIAELFGVRPGEIATEKMVDACKKAGFKFVFDTNFAADLTIQEEVKEFLERFNDPDSVLPMFTSCCPGWINLIEQKYPELIPHLSTCRSPMMMLGPVIKTFWANKMNYDPSRIYSVALMPCTAKKGESDREEMFMEDGSRCIDAVLTTRELAKLLKNKGIHTWNELGGSKFDSTLGESTGGGAIFGVSGGVMEAALREVWQQLTKKPLNDLEMDVFFHDVRGIDEHVKVFELDLKAYGVPRVVRGAVVHGANHASNLLRSLKDGEDKYGRLDFIEVMACPGGCISGGGQPKHQGEQAPSRRFKAIYKIDRESSNRYSGANMELSKLYKEFLDKDEHLRHELLHTSYSPKPTKD